MVLDESKNVMKIKIIYSVLLPFVDFVNNIYISHLLIVLEKGEYKKMKKKLISVLLCMLILATIPIATGMQCDKESEESLGLFSKTTVKGFIFGSSTTGLKTTFFAVVVKYTTSNLFGEEESGILVLREVTFLGKFCGQMGDFYISGTFRGTT